MQKFTLAAIGAACLFAAPAFAATGTAATDAAPAARPMQQARQKIVQDLTKDGYTNIKVIPDSFLVHATNKQNEPVVMIINPDSVFSVTQLPGNQASASPSAPQA